MSFHKIQNENVVKLRIKILLFFFLILFSVLFSRLVYLQIFEHSNFYNLSVKNSFREIKIPPNRGEIFDRNGFVIANNTTRYDLWVQSQSLKNYSTDKISSVNLFIKKISSIIEIRKTKKVNLIEKLTYSNPYDKILIKKDITMEELSLILTNKKFLPELDIKAVKIRSYPDNGIHSSLIGYVGNTTEKELKQSNYMVQDTLVGKNGLEKVFDKQLYGEYGIEEIVLNSSRAQIDISKKKRSMNGYNITTTIDRETQKLAVNLLGKFKGSVVAMDPQSGDLITMVSTPIYDPNLFARGLNQKEYVKIQESGALFNRSIYGQYPPASTIKPFVALSFLDGDWVQKDEILWCGPYWKIPGQNQLYRDWKRAGHGHINLMDAIERSSDVFFYRASYRSGFNFISDYLKVFGFGEKTMVNLPYERSGLIPTSDWKIKNKGKSWYDGETIVNSIGQGFNMATPMQLAYATGALANGGNLFVPNYILGEKSKIKRKIDMNKEDWDYVMKGMHNVVYGEHGTAKRVGYKSQYEIAGKTGTSQVFSTRGKIYNDDKLKKELKDHALFVGFAPFDNPKIAISVVLENGGNGSVTAAPIAQEIIDLYLNKHFPELKKMKKENKINE